MTNKENGDLGELEVIDLISCPNCHKKLQLLFQSQPLFDVMCTSCMFRAQVKSNLCKPKNEIRGAGWNIMDKYLKCGYQVPPLIANFKWEKGHEIIFYPFITRENLKKRLANIKSKNREHWMFNYKGLNSLPQIVVYKKIQD